MPTEGRIAALEAGIARVEPRIAESKVSIAGHEHRIAATEEGIARVEPRIAERKVSIAGDEHRIAAIEEGIAATVVSLESGHGGLVSRGSGNR